MKLNAFVLGFVLVLVIMALGVGCQKKNSSLPPPQELSQAEAQKYVYIKNPELVTHNTFTMVKPKDWQEIPYSSNTLVYLPPDGSINDSFSEKISMIVGFLLENETRSFEELTQQEIAKSKEAMPSMEVIGQEAYRLGQIDGIRLVFTLRVENRAIEITQLRASQGRVLYAFSQQCEKCEYTDIFYEMAGSFEWKNP
jgi:hypothetical protein